MKSDNTILHLIQSRYEAAKYFPRIFLHWKSHVLSTSRTIREFILTLESQSAMPLRLHRSVSPFLRFNEQLAHARNGRNTSDELKLASGVSKSSIRYVSTSPEGWIGFASKSGGEGPVKGFGQGRPVEREWGGGWCSQWSAHLADPTSLTSLMIYVELQAPWLIVN